jgi:aspartate aminotransferase
MIVPNHSSPALRAANRIQNICKSEIMKITLAVNDRRARGQDVIALAAGEPDFDTPEHIKAAAVRAMTEGHTKYTPDAGTPAFKEAIKEKFRRENGLHYAQEEITASSGAKQIIFNAMMATLNPGDEVIIPAPYWLSYADIVTFAGARPILLPCPETAGFRLTAEQLDAALTPNTRWVFLNSPSNPSGAGYSAAHLRPVLDVLLTQPHVWVLADDIYEHIVYDDFHFVTPAALEPALKARTLTVNGVSKAYAMTGWRIGYAGGPKQLINAMGIVQSQSATCAGSISQAAATEALIGSQDIVRKRCQEFELRRNFIVSALNRVPGLSCRTPEGAFFAFANCSGLIGRKTRDGKVLSTDRDFVGFLLDEAGVAVAPGSVFGLANFVRLSYAAARSQLEEASQRITQACAQLSE